MDRMNSHPIPDMIAPTAGQDGFRDVPACFSAECGYVDTEICLLDEGVGPDMFDDFGGGSSSEGGVFQRRRRSRVILAQYNMNPLET